MRQLLLTVAVISTVSFSAPARAQGVPTFDNTQLGQLVAQLEHMAEDLKRTPSGTVPGDHGIMTQGVRLFLGAISDFCKV
jgi:hypothetical protein